MKIGKTLLIVVATLTAAVSASAQTDAPVVVQPGRPGAPSKILPADTHAVLPARSAKDIEFMQGMIMHHAQAVEMTALIDARTQNKALRKLGARISLSQSDEMAFMRRWLAARGESETMSMPATAKKPDAPASTTPGMSMPGMNMPGMEMPSATKPAAAESMPMMPGMLTPAQMDALRRARGAEFDKLFLQGMIQHHRGALVMVGDMFNTSGAGQDAELFNFASDVDTGQRAEIKIMESMLGKEN